MSDEPTLTAAGTSDGRPARRPAVVREIDFTRPIKFASDQARQIELAHEGFARRASTRLSLEMRTATSLDVIATSQSVWSLALEELPASVMIAVGAAAPTNKQVLIATETPFVMHMLDRLLGGFGRVLEEPDGEERTLSAIDRALAGRLFEGLIEQLSETWTDLGGISFSLLSVEPQVSNVFSLALVNEPVLVISLRAAVAEIDSTITIILPYDAIAPVSEGLQHRFDSNTFIADTTPVTDGVRQVNVDMVAELYNFDLPVADAMLLKPGARIPLGHPPEEIGLVVEGVRVYRARPRQQDGRFLAQVIEREEQE